MIDQPLAVLTVLLGTVLLSIRITERYAWAKRLSTVLWIIFTSATASNLGLIPTDAPLYGAIVGFMVPFAMSVILFTVRLSQLRDAGAAILAAFVLASVGTVLGVITASIALEPLMSPILGGDSWKFAGPYTGTFIGGGLNFFALWNALEVGNPDLLAAAKAVDSLTLVPLFAFWMVIPGRLAGKWVTARRWAVPDDMTASVPSPAEPKEKPALDPPQLVALVFLAMLAMAASDWLKVAVIDHFADWVPAILIVTTLSLMLAQFEAVGRLKGATEIGDLAFYVFFAAAGAMIDVYEAVVVSPALFLYVGIILLVHLTCLYGIGRVTRMDFRVLTIASVATTGGPATAVPVAEAWGWRHLMLPGVVAGMLGYAVGNYVGWAVALFVRSVLT